MKPALFEYSRPEGLLEAISLKQTHGESAVFLAGGQSLVPAMNLRESTPSHVIDINRVQELHEFDLNDEWVTLGSLCRFSDLLENDDLRQRLPMLGQAISCIASPGVRHRGTIGGSIAQADAHAEMPAVLCALDADIELQNTEGSRRVNANNFFLGKNWTAIEPDEILTRVHIPIKRGAVARFDELSRRHGGYAMCGLAGTAVVDGNIVREVRLVFVSAGPTPVTASSAMQCVEGQHIDAEAIAAAQQALAEDLNPEDHLQCSSVLYMHYAKVLLERVLLQLRPRG